MMVNRVSAGLTAFLPELGALRTGGMPGRLFLSWPLAGCDG